MITTKSGYKFNPWIFRGLVIFLISILAYIGFASNWDFSNKFYLKCDGPTNCENPFYEGYFARIGPDIKCGADWCKQQFLSPGEYGDKPGFFYTYFNSIAIVSFVLAFVINHLAYNRNFKFKVEVIE